MNNDPGSSVHYRQMTWPVVQQRGHWMVTPTDNKITYSSDDLHKLRPNKTTVAKDVRKTIFACKI